MYNQIQTLKTVQQLIDKELLNIREQNGVVTLFISMRLHAAMMDDERKLSRWYMRLFIGLGCYKPSSRYKNMLRHILMYINCMRWAHGEGSYEEPLNILVSNTKEDDILLYGGFFPSEDLLYLKPADPAN